MKAKTEKIILNFGQYLSMEKGCYKIRDREGNIQRIPQFENQIGEVILKSGNAISVGALASFGFWSINVLILTQKGMPVATLRSIDDEYSNVETRIQQVKALDNGKGKEIARQIILAKLKGQNEILKKYGLRQHDIFAIQTKLNEICKNNLETARRKLLALEGQTTNKYYQQVFQLLPPELRISQRKTKGAFDGINNLLNLAFTMLKWQVTKAILNAHLEMGLGYVHATKFSKPSLCCDLMEIYRFLVEDFILQYCLRLSTRDFIYKTEKIGNRKGKREYLNDKKTKDLMKDLTAYFEKTVEIPRIMHGNRSSLETMISEQALLLAKYLRNEIKEWTPSTRIAVVN